MGLTKKTREVEAGILPPDVALFILNHEVQRIRPDWTERKTTTRIIAR
jgi:hypothetical protein